MDYEGEMKEAARQAERGVNRAIESLRRKLSEDEDDLTGVLKGNLDAELDGTIGGLTFDCKILRHRRGSAAEEREFGADLLIHVKFDAPKLAYDKGLLIQSKRVEPARRMGTKEHGDLVEQCKKMLKFTPDAWVFDYYNTGMRAGPATVIAGSTNRILHDQCPWTAYRFFLELFRCPIGDPDIVTPYPEDLRVKTTVKILATGTVT
jgi:hypothetical protein